jgi:type IV secretory pathway TrbD component
MKQNVGGMDRMMRIILGVIIIVVGFIFKSWWGAIGIVPILTGIVQVCPAYFLCRMNTAEKKND